MYGCLDLDIWGADWEKGWVTCWQTEALEAQTWNSPAAALQHYITTDFTVIAAAASCHRQDVMGREQLNATAVSHTTKLWTGGSALRPRNTRCTVFIKGQTSSHRMMICTSNKRHTSSVIQFNTPQQIHDNEAECISLHSLIYCMADTGDTTRFLFFHKHHIIWHVRKKDSICSWQLSQNRNDIKVKKVCAERAPQRTWWSNTACGLSHHQSPVKPYLTCFKANVYLSSAEETVVTDIWQKRMCIVSKVAEQVGLHVWPLQILQPCPRFPNQHRRQSSL